MAKIIEAKHYLFLLLFFFVSDDLDTARQRLTRND